MTSIGINSTHIRGGGLGLEDFMKGAGDIAVCSFPFKLDRPRRWRWVSETGKEGVDPGLGVFVKASGDLTNFVCGGHEGQKKRGLGENKGRRGLTGEKGWYERE
jgi:hypothetical protein